MKKEKFNQLLESVQQMGRIRGGTKLDGMKLSYRVKPATPTEVKEVRIKVLGLTQIGFARVIGESPSAVRHWEQGRRRPSGSATKIIRLLKNHPDRLVELR